jgi:uncharacterized protein YbcI
MNRVDKLTLTMAQQIAQAAGAFEQQRTGQVSREVTAVLIGETLVITLHGALSRAEKIMAETAEGAAQVREFHRVLFDASSESLRLEIERITGVEVRQGNSKDSSAGTIVPLFEADALVQMFVLTSKLPTQTWSGSMKVA